MKIQKFIDSLQGLISYGVDVDLKTFKAIILRFQKSLSTKEKERWNIAIEILLSYDTTQKSIKENYIKPR